MRTVSSPAASSAPIDPHVPFFDGGIEYAGDAVLIAMPLAPAHALGIVFIAWNRHLRARPIDRILIEHAGRLAFRIPHKMTVGRIGDSLVETEHFAGLRIDDRAVDSSNR